MHSKTMHLSEIAGVYLDDLAGRVTPRHLGNVTGKLRRVIADLADPDVSELRPIDLIRVRNAIRSGGASNRTSNLHADVVVAMLRWAEDAGLIAANPVPRLAKLPETRDCQRYRRRALTVDEARRLIDAAEAEDDRLGRRAANQGRVRVPQAPLFTTLLQTGIRYGEARTLRWADVDLDERAMLLRAENTKARRSRALPLRDELAERLRGLRAFQERAGVSGGHVLIAPTGRPWPATTAAVSRVLERLLRAAGIPKHDHPGDRVDVHALRHSFATHLARSGVPLMHTQKLLGHATPVLTAKVYSHLVAADLRAAVDSVL